MKMKLFNNGTHSLRAIPFEYTWGGWGVERSPIKKSWGEGVKIKNKKNHWARGLSNIEKHVAGGGRGATWQFCVVMLYFAT